MAEQSNVRDEGYELARGLKLLTGIAWLIALIGNLGLALTGNENGVAWYLVAALTGIAVLSMVLWLITRSTIRRIEWGE
jgi:hypothetical protein